MLDRFYANAVLPAKDAGRARSFYRDTLGLKLLSSPEDDPMMFEAGAGTGLVVTEMPERDPAGYPIVSFMVTDIEQLVGDLKERGVTFQDFGSTSFHGRAGVATGEITDYGPVKSAWFRDSEGNVLALNEILSAQ